MLEDKVSIIVPIYNGEKYIDACIKSILNQTYKNIELILVDDESPDNCGKICEEYSKKDKRIIVVHQKNGGVSNARNNGIEKSTGKYICFVDQDDYISDDYVEYLLNLAKQNNCEIALVPNVIYASDNKKIYSEKRNSNECEIWSGEKAASKMLYSMIEIGPWSKIVSKDLIEKNNIRFYEDIFGGDGYAFSVESFMASKRVAVGYKGVYYYRVDNYSSEMSKFRPRTLECSIKAVNIMYNEFSDYSNNMKKATKYAQWRVYVSFLNNLIASKMIKEYKKEYKMLISNSRKYAYRSFFAKVPLKRKIKDILYFVSPVLVAKINVNRNKKRDFNKGE